MQPSLVNRTPFCNSYLMGPLKAHSRGNLDPLSSRLQQIILKILRTLKPRANRLGICVLHQTAGFLAGSILGYGICKLDKYLFEKAGSVGVYQPKRPPATFYYIMSDVQKTLNLAILLHTVWTPLGPTMTIATLSTGMFWGFYCGREFNFLGSS